MWEEIQVLYNEGEYENVIKKSQDIDKSSYDDVLSIIVASAKIAIGDYDGAYENIRDGLVCNPFNYELYYMLGEYYSYCGKINQAYICYEQAVFYCNSKEDESFLEEVCLGARELSSVKKVGIVIVTYNSDYLQQKNIESIRETCPKDAYAIVCVDNASSDGVLDYLRCQEDIYLIENDTNVGFAPACNQGVSLLGELGLDCDILLLNNDTRLAPNAFFWLRMGLYERDSIGAAGSFSNYAGNNQQLNVEFELPKSYLDYGATLNVPGIRSEMDALERRTRLSGFCMLIRKSAWDSAGGMNENYAPGYFEDDALSMDITLNGYELVACKNSFIYHAGSQSFAKREDVNELLISHHQLFMKQYGFDILDKAYADEHMIRSIPYGEDDAFNVLEIGCGIGANLHRIKDLYPNANVVGLEKDCFCNRIAASTELVFDSVEKISQALSGGVFNIVIANAYVYAGFSAEEKQLIAKLCARGCKFIQSDKYKSIDFSKVKLVVWDLDDTFWRGTLSEGEVELIRENVELIRSLADCGIVNSISSKNDCEPVEQKISEIGLLDYFVFNNINWESKGQQIADKLKLMKLRPDNVLFIDDNVRNLSEAKYIMPEIMTGEPDIIPYLKAFVDNAPKNDREHKRLAQYRILESREMALNKESSKEDFLYNSNICVEINRNCLEEIDRLVELVQRTNQLNYTKNRDSKDLLIKLVTNDWNDCGYVKVSDRFGDYGIAGFFCFNKREGKMEHLLFSCRISGMGVEQYIYNYLGCPDFAVAEPVSYTLEKNAKVDWIKEEKSHEITRDSSIDKRARILLKGPCDLSAIEGYLFGANLTTEFNYVNNKGLVVSGQNHSMHIWQSEHLGEEEIKKLADKAGAVCVEDFQTLLFKNRYNFICFSLITDATSALYKNNDGLYFEFDRLDKNLCDKEWQQKLINQYDNYLGYRFTEEFFEAFEKEWEYIGRTPTELLIRNLSYIYENVLGEPTIILILGDENVFGSNPFDELMAEQFRDINEAVREFARGKERIKLLEISKYVNSEDCIVGDINHFSREVYFGLAGELVDCINEAMKNV